MDKQKFLNSRRAGELALGLSRMMPPGIGKRVAQLVSGFLTRQKNSSLIQAIRANQWVASGENLSARELDLRAKEVLRQTGISFYNLFHNMENPQALQALVDFNPAMEAVIQRSKEKKHGLVVAGVHISNFDLVAQAAALHGLKGFALSLPNPDETVQWQHNLRRKTGLEIMDASIANLRQTILRLENGETMVTGIDRPVPDPKLKPLFFRRPAHLAVHHVQLALKAKVPIVVMGAIYGPDGLYHIHSSGELNLKTYSDRDVELLANMERILEVCEDIIRLAPDQWAVFQPVWPEVLPLLP